ncbi:MAG TPA: 23S rRNA (guanosine(2251)-2'-O)-methyltransferase RlmB [Dongiaceae bacterium]|jgi:23S rRNA (guanosine2251-2'-O)-methyltransferase|nr:23S rRNA (guanosine(2251)-2'-O)-methyltransferase RlmB [Dongiaceae bacterium]
MHKRKPHFHREEPARNRPARQHPKARPEDPPSRQEREAASGAGAYWIYGRHAVTAALANPARTFLRLVESGQKGELPRPEGAPNWEHHDNIGALLPRDSVHQGLAALVRPLAEPDIAEICARLEGRKEALLVLLDQVTDPHNVGAILRSAAAFGAEAVILTERNAAPQSGVLAKAASGGLEIVSLARTVNLARAIDEIKQAGFWITGLAGEAERTLDEIDLSGKTALVLGSEENGLRRLTRERADHLARLPTGAALSQLNVSNAAAVALYEVARRRKTYESSQ